MKLRGPKKANVRDAAVGRAQEVTLGRFANMHEPFEPWSVAAYKHSVAGTVGVKDCRGAWVAKLHPLNGKKSDLELAEQRAAMVSAAPEAKVALEACSVALAGGTEFVSFEDALRLVRIALDKMEGR